jgi:AcrR family transcriptional regulator
MKKQRKQDLRVVKTKTLIKNAFLELIELNGYSKVTVTDIVEKAMINRNTFYLHYYDKEALIDEMISEHYKITEPLIRKILYNNVKKYLKDPIKMQEEIFKDIFEILLEEIELYRIFIMDPGLSGYLNKLKTTIKSKMQSEYIKTDKHKIAFEFTFEGTYGTIIEWIKNDYTNKETLALELSHIYNNIWLYVYNNEDLITVMKSFKEK